jgi:CRP/FNR family transcriptional regulator
MMHFTYLKGKILGSAVGECNGLVIVRNGQIRAFITSADGKEVTLYRLLSNDICIMSASCVLKNINFTVSLEIEKDCEVYILPANIFDKINSENIKVNEYSLKLMSSRFSDVMFAMEQIVFGSMQKRVAAFLIEQSVLEDSDTINTTHETIAKNLGTAREVVSRMLKYFENEGIIEIQRGQVKILDDKKLQDLAD